MEFLHFIQASPTERNLLIVSFIDAHRKIGIGVRHQIKGVNEMIIKISKFIIYLLLLIIFMNCERGDNIMSGDTKPSNNNRIDLDYSLEDTLEAQKLGLWFSGDLLLSDSLFSEMLYSINYLRYVFGDPFTVLKNRFMPPWQIGVLLVGFDDSTANQVTNHQYTGWDSLEEYLRPDTIIEYPDRLGIALLGFEEQLNPWQLSKTYSTLPGVRFSEPNGYTFAGGTFPIFPGYLHGEMTYLFVQGYSYIPEYYFYFKYLDQEPVFIGQWNPQSQPQPNWWDEAEVNIENFATWNGP